MLASSDDSLFPCARSRRVIPAPVRSEPSAGQKLSGFAGMLQAYMVMARCDDRRASDPRLGGQVTAGRAEEAVGTVDAQLCQRRVRLE